MTRRRPCTYRITEDDQPPQYAPTYRKAVAKQKKLYREGAERVQIAKECW